MYGRTYKFLTILGFTKSRANPILYLKVMDDEAAMLLLYVDVEPHFVTIFELKTLCINANFVIFWRLLHHTYYHLASGMILFWIYLRLIHS